MLCKNCGTEIGTNKYCSFCGTDNSMPTLTKPLPSVAPFVADSSRATNTTQEEGAPAPVSYTGTSASGSEHAVPSIARGADETESILAGPLMPTNVAPPPPLTQREDRARSFQTPESRPSIAPTPPMSDVAPTLPMSDPSAPAEQNSSEPTDRELEDDINKALADLEASMSQPTSPSDAAPTVDATPVVEPSPSPTSAPKPETSSGPVVSPDPVLNAAPLSSVSTVSDTTTIPGSPYMSLAAQRMGYPPAAPQFGTPSAGAVPGASGASETKPQEAAPKTAYESALQSMNSMDQSTYGAGAVRPTNQPPYIAPGQKMPDYSSSYDYSGRTGRSLGTGRADYLSDPEVAPLSVVDYIVMMLVASIPFVGFVMMIIWAMSSTENINRRNWARACLMIGVGAIVLAIVLVILLIPFLRYR